MTTTALERTDTADLRALRREIEAVKLRLGTPLLDDRRRELRALLRRLRVQFRALRQHRAPGFHSADAPHEPHDIRDDVRDLAPHKRRGEGYVNRSGFVAQRTRSQRAART